MSRAAMRARSAAFYLVTAVAAGDTLHLAGHRLGLPLTHHAFHLLFTVAAVVVFAGAVARDWRRHGRPRFSWQL